MFLHLMLVFCFQVVMHKNGYTLAVDVWSVGCTILEMATAKPPWSQFEGVYDNIIFLFTHLSNYSKTPSCLSLPGCCNFQNREQQRHARNT